MIEIRDTSTPIVILQFVPSLQHGGLGVARTAGRLGVRVYWIGSGGRVPAALSRYIRGTFHWDASAPVEATVAYLQECSRKIEGNKPILIPIDDAATIFVADQADALREHFRFPDQPAGLARTLSSKKEMYFLCKKTGVPTPEAAFPQSLADVETFAETAVFPVVVKIIAGWNAEHRSRLKSVTIVNSTKELLKEYAANETPGQPNIMLQEYIPGGPEDVWMFNGYFTDSSECLIGFTGKKIRQAPPFTGATTLGICLGNETVEKMTGDFMRRIGYRGIVDMGYRYDRRDGQYKLLDVNPRVGATFRLFVDSNGMDVVRALYLDLTGRPVRSERAREGRKWIVEQGDLATALRYGRLGRLTVKEWARSLRGIEEAAWFAWDDPLPFAAMCWGSLVKGARIVRDRVWSARAV